MCRLFGFRSVIDSQVHSSLVEAENALVNQSTFHPDGWGVAYYLASTPHVVKSVQSAVEDTLFKKVSGVVSAKTVLAHLRKSTIGDKTAVNTHPFQHGRWTFGHNGNIKDFERHRESLLGLVDIDLRKYILGHTDSEIIFYILLSEIRRHYSIYDLDSDYQATRKALQSAIAKIVDIVGPPCPDDSGPNTETFLTFILTDGTLMFGYQGGKSLHYSTYKSRCPERESCPKFNPFCEAPANGNAVNHLIFSSEPLMGENIWEPLEFSELLGVGKNMKIDRQTS